MPIHLDRLTLQAMQPRSRRLWRVAFAALLAFVSYQAISTSSGSPSFEHMDKALHVSAFACLACVASWSWPPSRQAGWSIALGLTAYGVFIELVQLQLPWREASVADVVADVAGLALGLALAHRARARWAKPDR
jgi:VanZ family protein